MEKIVNLFKKLFGKEQKRLPCAVIVTDFIRIKPYYDRSDSYWE